jgi:hypothetical protein
MRRTRAACCARAASDHAAAPLSSDMKARRLIEERLVRRRPRGVLQGGGSSTPTRPGSQSSAIEPEGGMAEAGVLHRQNGIGASLGRPVRVPQHKGIAS